MTIAIEHVGVWVRDLDSMKVFYETYFGAQTSPLYHNPKTGFSSYFLSFDQGARLELCHRADITDAGKDRFGFTHLAIALGDEDAVDALAFKLRDAGFALINGPRTTGDGYYEALILDPEDNQIELTTHLK